MLSKTEINDFPNRDYNFQYDVITNELEIFRPFNNLYSGSRKNFKTILC